MFLAGACMLAACGDEEPEDMMPPQDASAVADASVDAPPSRTPATYCLISYGPLPNPALTQSEGGQNILQADYATKATFVSDAQSMFLTDIVTALAIDSADVMTEVRPGGFSANSFPSMYTRYETTSDKDCDRLGAAFGYVFRQQSVLVFRYDAGDSGHVQVDFPSGELDGASAQAFFVHAIGENLALQGGYSAFGDSLIFINLRSPGGFIYSGLDDEQFVQAMEDAAGSYSDMTLTTSAGESNAHLVENNWTSSTDGSKYLTVIDGDTALETQLTSLLDAYETLMDQRDAALGD